MRPSAALGIPPCIHADTGAVPLSFIIVEWNPEPQDQGPFWPGAAESRRPRWSAILIAVAVVILVVAGVIWWLGRGGGDDGPTAAPEDRTEEPDDSAGSGEPATGDSDGDGGREPDAVDGDETTTETTAPTTTTTTPTATTTIGATTTTVTTVPPENPEQFGTPTLSSRSTVSTVGLDTVHFGMTVADAQVAAGTVLVPAGPTGPCYHVVPHDAPEGIVFLVHQGTIERVDVNSGPITTRSGVGVGSPERMVTDLFGDSIERQVRIDGTVDLVYVPRDPGDRDYRVVFNVSEGAVRALKSGRLPQVMLDTGCESE